jgi:hypothetical protein
MSIDIFEFSNKPTEIFHYTTSRWDWIDCNVNQMWIEDIGKCQYVAVAYNPRKDKAVVVSEPRGYYDTLQWVRKWCNSFCILSE